MGNSLHFETVLAPQGLLSHVRLDVDEAGRIADLVSGVEEPATGWDGAFAIPGMPCAHSHAFQRALAGYGEARAGDDSFWSWREAMYRLALAITPDQLYAVARQCYADMLRGGFTAVAEFHYLHHGVDGGRGTEMAAAVVEAARDVGIGMRLLPVYYRTGGFGESAGERQRRFLHGSIEEFASYLEKLKALDVPLGLAPHSLRAAPADELTALVEATDAVIGDQHPVHIHISEQIGEVEDCVEAHGVTPIRLLADNVELSPRWQLVHATHATHEELRLMEEAGAGVVLCPLTEAYLGDGVFPATDFHGPMSIGADSDVRLDACEELRLLEYGQRLRDQARARLADGDGLTRLWTETAVAGASACGLETGALAVGRDADVLVLDRASPVLAAPRDGRVMDAWLTAGSRQDIHSVYARGRPLIHAGRHDLDSEFRESFVQAVRRLHGEEGP